MSNSFGELVLVLGDLNMPQRAAVIPPKVRRRREEGGEDPGKGVGSEGVSGSFGEWRERSERGKGG